VERKRTAGGKLLDVLGTFGRDQQHQTLTQIAHRAQVPLSTAHRIISELAERGVLDRGEDGTWHVGLRLWEIATGCPRTQILRDVAAPAMQDLYEATHENVHLTVREGTESVFVELISGRHSVGLVTHVGARLPLAATGMGRVLLAYAPQDIIDAVLESPLYPWTEHTLVDADQLRTQLEEIRREQVFVSDRQLQINTVAVAAPIRVGTQGPVNAAISVVIAAERAAEVRRLRVPLLRAAHAVTNELGLRARE
jgi:DNA-binding IclR family transcriptional regulator